MPPTVLPLGAVSALNEARAGISSGAADDDEEEERESYEAALLTDEADSTALEADDATDEADSEVKKDEKTVSLNADMVHQTVKLASQDVITSRTLSAYRQQWKSFINFLTANSFLGEDEKLDPKNLPAQMPEYIAIWIMDKCDNIDIYSNVPKPLGYEPCTYSHAQKMRAAMTHHFGRECGLGLHSWTESEVNPGRYIGNPSLSTVVSQYMVSLRRKKTKSGEVVTSARAMEEPVLREIHEFNEKFPEREFGRKKREEECGTGWAGRKIRIMITLLYILAFLCLLRFDEALRIRWSDLILTRRGGGTFRLEVRLPFRKTHQTGGIAPFYLFSNHDKPWLCPIRAYARWADTMRAMGMELEGYVFRPRIGFDKISSSGHQAMKSAAFLECFRNNLLDIKIDPRYYGTHSFRRGGCQYLAIALRWSYRQICDWGGWAENFDNPGTLFKYLLSWVDNPLERREDFFNPDRPHKDHCSQCGRTCDCA